MVWHRRHPAPGNNISLHGKIKLQKAKHYSPRHGEPQMQEWPVRVLSSNARSRETAFCKCKTGKETVLFNVCVWVYRAPQIPSLTHRKILRPVLLRPQSSAGSGQRWSIQFYVLRRVRLHKTVSAMRLEGQTRGRLHLEHSWSPVRLGAPSTCRL